MDADDRRLSPPVDPWPEDSLPGAALLPPDEAAPDAPAAPLRRGWKGPAATVTVLMVLGAIVLAAVTLRGQAPAGARLTSPTGGTGTAGSGVGSTPAQPAGPAPTASRSMTGPAHSAGPPRTAATIRPPAITVTGSSSSYTSVTVRVSVNSGDGPTTCTLAVSGAGSRSGGCASLTVTGLALDTVYSYTVTASNAIGRASATGSQRTQALSGTIICTDIGDGACANGVGIYSQPMQDSSARTDWNGHNGVRYPTYCQTPGGVGNQQTGATLYAGPYNSYKTSAVWIRIGPSRYVPWVWLNLDNGDQLTNLPAC
jgi:hypothetical protein